MSEYIEYTREELALFEVERADCADDHYHCDEKLKVKKSHFKNEINEIEEDIGESVDNDSIDFLLNDEMAILDHNIGKVFNYSDRDVEIEAVNLKCDNIDDEYLYFTVKIESVSKNWKS